MNSRLITSSVTIALALLSVTPAFADAGNRVDTTARRHANGEHPAVLVARQASTRGIDSNTFLVQPPTSVTWTLGPVAEPADPVQRLASGKPAAAPTVATQ